MNDFFVFINHPSKKERMVKIMKQFNIYKSTMKYLTDKNLSLNAKGFLTIILFNDGIIGLDIQKYCTDNYCVHSAKVRSSAFRHQLYCLHWPSDSRNTPKFLSERI